MWSMSQEWLLYFEMVFKNQRNNISWHKKTIWNSISVSINKICWNTGMLLCLLIYCLQLLLHCTGCVEWLLHGQQCLKYLLSDPLQKKFANSYSIDTPPPPPFPSVNSCIYPKNQFKNPLTSNILFRIFCVVL